MPFRTLREFIKLESSAGIILFCAAILALVLDNSPWHEAYQHVLKLPIILELGAFRISKPLLLWINDGFMAVFFLLVGLEVKRELFEGELNSLSKALLPAIAAVGGMVVPALIFVLFNHHDPVALRGWAIPTATDIAFSLGILSLLGSRIPVTLKIFLTALAIFDDVGAIVVIAIFYSGNISLLLLFVALGFVLILFIFNRLNLRHFAPYMIVGFALWVCVLKSGVHATLAGIVLAFAIPLRDKRYPLISRLRDLEYMLHPWVAFGILPLFAFANAGIYFKGLSVEELTGGIPLGILCGLFIGKQIGIWGSSMLAVKLNIANLPHNTTGSGIYGVSLIAGVGFTMSLFIGTLAFGNMAATYAAQVKLGVLAGSFLAGALGYVVLRFGQKFHPMLQP